MRCILLDLDALLLRAVSQIYTTDISGRPLPPNAHAQLRAVLVEKLSQKDNDHLFD